MTDADVVPIRALSEDEALAWLAAQQGPVDKPNTMLASCWGWNDVRVGRRLRAWEQAGKIVRSDRGITSETPAPTGTDIVAVEPVPHAVARVALVEPDGYRTGADMSAGAGCTHAALRGSWGHRVVAYLTGIALASAAAYFSIGGLVELFPAQATAVAVLGALLEVTKLVMVAWLAANWRHAGGLLRLVMVVLVVGLMAVNGGGTFARLIESHLSIVAAASTAVGERTGVLDAKIAEQERRVTQIEVQDREIADAVAKMTSSGRAKAAIAATEAQQKRREGIARARQDVADRLVELQGDRARLDAESRRVAARSGSARYLAIQLGTDAETVIRWLVALLVLLIDPSAVVLTIAASRQR
jgi:hypothetical protein